MGGSEPAGGRGLVGSLAVLSASYGWWGPILFWLCFPTFVFLVTIQGDVSDYGTLLWSLIDVVNGLLVFAGMALVGALLPVWVVSFALIALAWRSAAETDRRPRVALVLNLLAPVSWVVEVGLVLGGLYWLLQDFRL